jgi:hypothetical protein
MREELEQDSTAFDMRMELAEHGTQAFPGKGHQTDWELSKIMKP